MEEEKKDLSTELRDPSQMLDLSILTYTSIQTDTPEGKMLFLKAATGEPDYSGDDLMNKPFPAENLFVARIPLQQEDGSMVEADRIVLISPEGETAAFVSKGVKTSLSYIMSPMMYGKPPFNPPIWVQTARVQTRTGYKCWNLKIVAPPTDQVGKGKR
jgi:hypothetical protein